MTQLEDSKIISLFFERSEQAIRELDCKYGSAVKKTAANILDDRLDVEECVDDTYMYHANHAEKRNGKYDLILDEMEECIPSGTDIETEYEAKELSVAINRFLSSLSREDRFLFVRRYWYADSVTDLAAMTNDSANRISVRLFRLREKLRKTLVKEGFLA